MEQMHDTDGTGVVAQLKALQLNGTAAVKELEVRPLCLCLRWI